MATHGPNAGLDQADRDHLRWPHRHHSFGAEPQPDAVRILSLDGGGARGVIPLVILTELEARTGKAVTDLFDVVAGTSTGAIIATLLNRTEADGRPTYSAKEVLEGYHEFLPRIFTHSRRDAIRGLGGVLHEKYPSHGLHDVLTEGLGDARLSQTAARVLIPSYELTTREVFVFDTDRARQDPASDFTLRHAALASTAAPTFFEPHDGRSHDFDGFFIDGGVVLNNPSLLAFTEVEKYRLGTDIVVLSLGCGASSVSLEYEEVREWGLAHWARPLLKILLDGNSRTVDFHMRELIGDQRYYRFQIPLGHGHDELDNIRPEALAYLEDLARQMIDGNERFDAVCRLIDR